MRRLLAFAVFALAACQSPDPSVQTGAPETAEPETAEPVAQAPTPGALAPAFALPATDGTEHRLADYRGRTVVLEWLNYDCPYVGKHYGGGAMQALQRDAAADSVVWLAIVSSAPGEQGHFAPDEMDARTASEGGRQSAVLLDPSGAVGRAYGAKTTPHLFVIDPAGRVVYNGAIDDRPTSDPADLDGATPYVRLALAAVAEGRAADPATTPPYGCSVKYGV